MRVAVCDEQRLFASVLASALAQQGHQIVLTTDDPLVLLDQAADVHPEICVLDILTGPPSVVKIAEQLAGLAPSPAVILLTDSYQDGVREAYEQGLVQGVVDKSRPFSVLMATIDRVAAGERVCDGWQAPGRRPSNGVVDTLTSRELEVLRLVVQGYSTQRMADQLGVSRHTIRTHVQQVLRKLGVHGRGKIARAAGAAGLVDVATLSGEGPPG